jgi:hypothetical protein
MSELTKEYFDQAISGLATKEGLAQQTEQLKDYARQQTEELARMVNEGFEDVHRRLDECRLNSPYELSPKSPGTGSFHLSSIRLPGAEYPLHDPSTLLAPG